MVENYLIKDTIRFTASIVGLDGETEVPGIVTVTVYHKDGTVLLNAGAATVDETPGDYYYDWKIDGTEENPLVKASDLIVVWDWDSMHKKRLKFSVIPEV